MGDLRAAIMPPLTAVLLATAGGFVGNLLGLPAGWLLGGSVAVAAAGLLGVRVTLPGWLRDTAFVLTGLSMGGYVALEVMRQAPERVSRLALLDTKASPDEPEVEARRRGLIELAQKGAFKGVTPRLLPLLVHPSRLEDEALTGHIMQMAENIGRDAFIRQQQAILGREDFRPTLATIRCPTLVLCGREDRITPVQAHREMAAGIADARLVVFDDCGHLPPLERPEATNRELRRWLTAET